MLKLKPMIFLADTKPILLFKNKALIISIRLHLHYNQIIHDMFLFYFFEATDMVWADILVKIYFYR